jgi:hypothetical protein
MATKRFDISGVTGNTLQIGSKAGGPNIKNASGTIQIRNSTDDAYANLVAPLRPPAGVTSIPPIVLTSGTPAGTIDGALEYDTGHIWFTIGATRYQLDNAGSTVPVGTAAS